MSTYTKLTWPVQDVEAVCKLQDIPATGPTAFKAVLNGTLTNPSIPDQISFARQNMIRSVSLTSVNNLSGINFTIQGFQNEAFVSEILPGPNGPITPTVYGTKYYDIITSITTSAAVTGIKVGTGDKGYFPLLIVNPNSTNINYSATILLPSGSGITYSLLQTLDQVVNNFLPLDSQLTKFFPCMGLTNKNTSEIGSSTAISNFILLKIISSTNPVTDTFNFIFLQQ